MPVFAYILLLTAALFAVEQEQPTPYDLIRPIWPMKWDTAATDDGGTVESFSKYVPNTTKHNPVPAVGSVPQDFVPNGIIPDSLNQAYRDAQNVRIPTIPKSNSIMFLRVNAPKPIASSIWTAT